VHYICKVFLFAGEKGDGDTTQKPLHYQGVVFHRVIKDFMVQAGDFVNGTMHFDAATYPNFFVWLKLRVQSGLSSPSKMVLSLSSKKSMPWTGYYS